MTSDPIGRGDAVADVGVFGGSGLTSFLDTCTERLVDTRWGPPSGPVLVGSLRGTRVAFLARHGVRHEIPPHRVNYRANVDAMRQLGVGCLLAPFTAGSLQPWIEPGDFVVVDQLVDRTSGRAETFHDCFDDGPSHVPFADPYDESLRELLAGAARDLGVRVHDHGTVVVVNGPRFSTRAESAWFRAMGWHVVNMTQHPETVLAREAGLRYAAVALVTDYDAGLVGGPDVRAVTQEQVFACFADNAQRVRAVLTEAIERVARVRTTSALAPGPLTP
jgi:5'-methylthioadenosine phosphorylase